MQNFATLPMPEGYGQQVETPQGWRFRHCATFFVGDRCPDCGKEGFLAAAQAINLIETPASAPAPEPETQGEQKPLKTPTDMNTDPIQTPPDGANPPQTGEQSEGADAPGEQSEEDKLLEDAARALTSGDPETAARLVTAANDAAGAPVPAAPKGGKQTRKQK